MSFPALSPHPALAPDPFTRTALGLAPRSIYLALGAAALLGASVFSPDALAALLLASVAGTLAVLFVLIRWLVARHLRAGTLLHQQIAAFVAEDASPSFTTDAEGQIDYQNRAALDRFGSRGGQALVRTLGEVFANPVAILQRMRNRAEALGSAREDMVTRRGHVRLAVHRIGPGGFLWRLEDMAERSVGGRGAESMSLPMLTVSKTGTVLFMNEALRRLVGERVRTLDRIFPDLPIRPGEQHRISGQDGMLRALVSEVETPGGRREIYLLPVSETAPPPAVGDPAAFEALPVALMRLTASGALVEMNAAARTLLGDLAPGTRLADRFEGLGRPIADWMADVLAGRGSARPEVLQAHGEGRELFLQVTLTRSYGPEGPGLVAVLSDATQLKTLEAQFVQSQKMQAIGQLAGGVAHDFNNLLTAISGHCDLLLLRHDRNDPDHADLTQISQNANRAASLVGQLLAFSRKQSLKPKIIDLRDTLADLAHLLNRLVGEKVRLKLTHDPDLRPVRADKRQLEQVIMNLVVNARDAMPGGGEIRIETENLRLAEALSRDRATVEPGDYVVVRVIDQGCGIAPDKLSKIFEPFFTTKRQGEGTGLGLSTAYGIVKQTGGFIFCDSEPGVGTTFTLYFPAHDVVDEPVDAPAAAPAPQRRTRSSEGVVLLVEDEAPVRAFARQALRLRGFTVIEAASGEEALGLLDDPSLAVDVFVTDVIMPGMDGPSWVEQALRKRPQTRVIFVSGYAEESFNDRRAAIANSVFLPKPFSLSELTATVQAQIA